MSNLYIKSLTIDLSGKQNSTVAWTDTNEVRITVNTMELAEALLNDPKAFCENRHVGIKDPVDLKLNTIKVKGSYTESSSQKLVQLANQSVFLNKITFKKARGVNLSLFFHLRNRVSFFYRSTSEVQYKLT